MEGTPLSNIAKIVQQSTARKKTGKTHDLRRFLQIALCDCLDKLTSSPQSLDNMDVLLQAKALTSDIEKCAVAPTKVLFGTQSIFNSQQLHEIQKNLETQINFLKRVATTETTLSARLDDRLPQDSGHDSGIDDDSSRGSEMDVATASIDPPIGLTGTKIAEALAPPEYATMWFNLNNKEHCLGEGVTFDQCNSIRANSSEAQSLLTQQQKSILNESSWSNNACKDLLSRIIKVGQDLLGGIIGGNAVPGDEQVGLSDNSVSKASKKIVWEQPTVSPDNTVEAHATLSIEHYAISPDREYFCDANGVKREISEMDGTHPKIIGTVEFSTTRHPDGEVAIKITTSNFADCNALVERAFGHSELSSRAPGHSSPR